MYCKSSFFNLSDLWIYDFRWMKNNFMAKQKKNCNLCRLLRHIMSKLDFIKICFSQPASSSSSSSSFDLKFSLQPRFHDNQSGSQSPKSNHVLSLDPHETLFIKMYSVRSIEKQWKNGSIMKPEESSFNKFFLIRALRFYFTVGALPCSIVSVQQSSSSRCISYSPSRCSTLALTSLSLTSYSHLSLTPI